MTHGPAIIVAILLILCRKNTQFLQISQIFYKKTLIIHYVNISLWERDVDVVLVQRVVDALQHLADYVRALRSLGPYS